MGPSLQLTIAAVGSVCTTMIALAIVAILLRLLGEQQEARELCTVTNNFIIFDHTRNAIVGDVSAVVAKGGGVTQFRPFQIDPKHIGDRVRLFAMLSSGEDSQLF